MNQKQRDAVVIGLLSLIAVLALVAATRTMPASQGDGLESTIRKVLQDCVLFETTKTNGIIGDYDPVVFVWDCGN